MSRSTSQNNLLIIKVSERKKWQSKVKRAEFKQKACFIQFKPFFVFIHTTILTGAFIYLSVFIYASECIGIYLFFVRKAI